MTTKVTVDAHAGWPVEVTTVDRFMVDGAEKVTEAKTTVPPHTTQDFYLTSNRELHLKEMPPAAQG